LNRTRDLAGVAIDPSSTDVCQYETCRSEDKQGTSNVLPVFGYQLAVAIRLQTAQLPPSLLDRMVWRDPMMLRFPVNLRSSHG
jgi:hypothetical protein